MAKKSALQIARAAYTPKLPLGLQGNVSIKEGAPTQSVADQEEVKKLFPNTYGLPLVEFVPGEQKTYAPMNVGVILSGGQAPGGHNVISGIFDGIKRLNPANKLYGFLLGPGGLVDHKYMEITAEIVDQVTEHTGVDRNNVLFLLGHDQKFPADIEHAVSLIDILFVRDYDIPSFFEDNLTGLPEVVHELHRLVTADQYIRHSRIHEEDPVLLIFCVNEIHLVFTAE